MSKAPIYILFLCSIITGTVLLWWLRKRKKEIADGIRLLEDGNYRIKDILFSVKKKVLVSEDKETPLAPQPYELLLMFLKNTDHRVNKKEIKLQFWPKITDSTGNMSSTVNRLNNILKDANCRYIINTDSRNEEYYVLIKSTLKKVAKNKNR